MDQERGEKSVVDIAMDRCNTQVKWYEDARNRKQRLFFSSQTFAIIAGGVTPVLVVLLAMMDSFQQTLMVLIAALPALAAILTGLNAAFGWKEDFIRFGYTAELLKSEQIKFQTHTTARYHQSKPIEERIDYFVKKIESIAMQETADWQAQVSHAMDLEETLQVIENTRSSIKAGA